MPGVILKTKKQTKNANINNLHAEYEGYRYLIISILLIFLHTADFASDLHILILYNKQLKPI